MISQPKKLARLPNCRKTNLFQSKTFEGRVFQKPLQVSPFTIFFLICQKRLKCQNPLNTVEKSRKMPEVARIILEMPEAFKY